MVEFALVAPLLMILLFGIVNFGRALNYWNDATNLPTISGGTGPVNPQSRATVVPITEIDPSAGNLALESLFQNDATAKPLWDSWVARQFETQPVSESWPRVSLTVMGFFASVTARR